MKNAHAHTTAPPSFPATHTSVDSLPDASPGVAASTLADEIRIRPGALSDYERVRRFHYRLGAPAAPVRVLVAELPHADPRLAAAPELLGVLVVSMPVLNSRVRDAAWPGRYRTGRRRADAALVNREVRVISRVVVDPRVRGVGIGRRLVSAYLDNPLTPATESLAAMGVACPFMSAAGMTEYHFPPTRGEARFEDYLSHLGATPHLILSRRDELARTLAAPATAHELGTLSRASPRRALAALPDDAARLRRVCVLLCSPRIGYAHTAESFPCP